MEGNITMSLRNSLLLVIFLAVTNATYSQNTALEKTIRVDSLDVKTLEAAASILRAAKIPGGIVSIDEGCASSETHHFAAISGTVQDGLASMIATDPAYEWSINEAVVDVEHQNGR